MSHLFEKFEKLVDRIPEGIERTRDTIVGVINPNHRHNDPEEKAHDAIREEIREQHRFRSFAGERSENFVKWHIDGHDYMYALSKMLDSARECVFILDWWLSPELYLRRPPVHNEDWRLDRVLQRKAQEGVKIYIIVYKEVTQTMSMSSHHTKSYLEAIHPNIAVMRHPDHIGSQDDVEFWSHHEKVFVVDNHRACIGGLDLCFGRWDTHNHPLADAHPTDFGKTIFPGQDYNNARVLDFQKVDNYASNAISILESGRMPWHDVHMTIAGPVVLDIVQHFTERWNEVKKRKYKTDLRYDWLALPHDILSAPNEPVARHPYRERWHAMGRHFRERFHIQNPDWEWTQDEEEDRMAFPRAPHGTCNVQVVRSVADWSHGVLKEASIQAAYCQLIREAEHFIYIENQFFVSNTGPNQGPVKNLIAQALVERILQAARAGQKFKVVVVIPEVPGFAGNISDEGSIKTIMGAQYRTINRGGKSIYEVIQKAGYDPTQYINFYHLRTYDRINAPLESYIKAAEERSGVKFHQAQVALAKEWVGDDAVHIKGFEQKTVSIRVPQPSQEGMTQSTSSEAQKIQEIPLPATEEEARDLIKRFEDAAKEIRRDEKVADNVGQHALMDDTHLLEEQWLGSEEEEKASYITELLYIHSKVMVVDDRRLIMGSANLNDRSQNGDHDSEIALVVEDTDMIEGSMNGEPYTVGRFAATFRRKIYREHLGLIEPQDVSAFVDRPEHVTTFMQPAPIMNADETQLKEDQIVMDPLSDELLELWRNTAVNNRNIFTEVFRPVPSDLVTSYEQYKNYVPKVKIGHVVPEIPLKRIKERLAEVRGHLVTCPLRFLYDETSLVNNKDWDGLNPTLPIYL